MRSIEVTAKSVDEAIFMGIDQLGLSIDQVDIEIIEEGGRRLFGIGSKQCVVRLTERAPEEVERVLEEQEKQAEQEAQEKKERQQARTRERGRKEPRGRRAQRTASSGLGRARRRRRRSRLFTGGAPPNGHGGCRGGCV